MKLRMLSLVVASMAVVAIAQDGVTLRRTFQANTQDTYACEFSGTQNMEAPTGPMEFKMKGSNQMLIKYKAVKDTTADIDMITKDLKFEMEGMEGMGGGPSTDNLPKEITVPGTIDTQNRMKFQPNTKGVDPMIQAMMSSLSSTNTGFFILFPDGQVKVGDTWDVPMPNPNPKAAEIKLKATLVSDKEGICEVKVAGKFPMDMDMSQMADQMGGMEMKMSMTMDTAYTVLIEKATGKAKSMTGNIDSTMKMEIPSMNIVVPGTGKMKYTATLK